MADPRRRTLGPVVLLGLAGAGLAAYGGNAAWASAGGSQDGDAAAALSSAASGAGAGEAPLAGALALVALACWGVLLVTRGRVRRAVAALAALAAAGVLVTLATEVGGVRDDVRASLGAVGVADADVGLTLAFWATLVGAPLALVAAVLAVRWAPGWPEMGRRYDAPGAAAPVEREQPSDNIDLWKSIDQGHDPTA